MKAQKWFEDWEQILSRFRLSSELSEINRHPGVVKHVSPVFAEVMLAAEKAEKLSGGLVTPTVLNALITAGYRDDFETLLERTGNEFEQTLLTPIEAGQVKFDHRSHTVELPFGTQLDFGGIAKGWAAQQVMLRIGDLAPVLVEAGGDIAISGLMQSEGKWPVGVANPFDPDNNLALLMIENGGIATSGKDYHRWMFNGEMQHHIIDPRTMRPAETDILTITVLASNVMDAETFAKTALIKGSEIGKIWLDEQSGVAYFMVLDNGTVIRNEQFMKNEWKPEWQIN
jgi:FAD:protein FMN transferase